MLNNVIALLNGGGAGGGGSSFESIATVTASGGETSLSFSSIPSTYKHLQIRGIARGSANNYLALNFNSDTASNYSQHYLRGNGSAAAAAGAATQTKISWQGETPTAASIYAAAIWDIQDYASTSKYKTTRGIIGTDDNSTITLVYLTSGLWQSTSAITSLAISVLSGTFQAGSTFALYGIKG